jgi:hypothetical protein
MTKISELLRRWSKTPAYKQAYDALEEEFDLARTLIEARTVATLSQAQLARRMKTSQSYIPPRGWEGASIDQRARALRPGYQDPPADRVRAAGRRLSLRLVRFRSAVGRTSTRNLLSSQGW